MSEQQQPIEPSGDRPPTEEELRAALEEEMRRVHVGDVILQTVVTLVQLAGRRLGTAPGTEGERDLEQAGIAIDSVRGLLPSVEAVAPSQAPAVRDALSQLQVAFVQAGGQPPAGPEPGEGGPEDASPEGPGPEGPGPGDGPGDSRIWVPPGVR
ncbi:MAG: hypothetical protein WCO96_03650 [Actinomycetes bacterium]